MATGIPAHVAIKVIDPVGLEDDGVHRFERECAAIGTLSGHPNIVTVHDHGRTADGRPYIVMEFLEGGSLGDRIAGDDPLSWPAAVDIAVKLSSALESAHRRGVLHRDVKPENVLLSRYGEPKLADFGIARIEGRSKTRTGSFTASLAHVPPEVLAGPGPRSRPTSTRSGPRCSPSSTATRHSFSMATTRVSRRCWFASPPTPSPTSGPPACPTRSAG